MKDYGVDAWRHLGSQIRTARKKAGYRDTKKWAEKVGRSSRVLLGLERGEPAGDDTLELVEQALDWETGWAETLLESGQQHSARLAAVPPAGTESRQPAAITEAELLGLVRRHRVETEELIGRQRAELDEMERMLRERGSV